MTRGSGAKEGRLGVRVLGEQLLDAHHAALLGRLEEEARGPSVGEGHEHTAAVRFAVEADGVEVARRVQDGARAAALEAVEGGVKTRFGAGRNADGGGREGQAVCGDPLVAGGDGVDVAQAGVDVEEPRLGGDERSEGEASAAHRAEGTAHEGRHQPLTARLGAGADAADVGRGERAPPHAEAVGDDVEHGHEASVAAGREGVLRPVNAGEKEADKGVGVAKRVLPEAHHRGQSWVADHRRFTAPNFSSSTAGLYDSLALRRPGSPRSSSRLM